MITMLDVGFACLVAIERVRVAPSIVILLAGIAMAGERLIAHGRVLKPGRLLAVAVADVYVEHAGWRELTATALATTRNIEPSKAQS